jgi:hypothetical protein
VSANTYLGLEALHTYDANLCAEYCNTKTLGTNFNVVAERDPCLNLSDSRPRVQNTAANPKPRSPAPTVSKRQNTNTPAQKKLGWQATQQCGGDGSKGHDHPKTCIGTSFFPGPYNPALCTVYAEVQNAINQKPPFWGKWIAILTGNYNPLKFVFFNNYTLKKNGKPLGTYCGLYSQQYSCGEATYVPSW